MGNILSGFQVASDPVSDALGERQTARRVLIVGAGEKCAKEDNDYHDPHPEGAVTLDLPPERTGFYQRPKVHGDIRNPEEVSRLLGQGTFDFVHFENVDFPVCTNQGSIQSAHALLAPGGTLLIETGGVRPQETVETIRGLLEALEFTNIYAMTTNGVQIVAKRGAT